MITRSLSRLATGERCGSVMEPRHKGVFPCHGRARRPGPCVGHCAGSWEQVERASAAANYWSSTSNANNPNNAWNVNFNNGNVLANDTNNNLHARAVRGGS
jgi:hypothetical protein